MCEGQGRDCPVRFTGTLKACSEPNGQSNLPGIINVTGLSDYVSISPAAAAVAV